MRVYSLLFLFLIVAGSTQFVQAQSERELRRAGQGKGVSQDELVSFNADVPYTKAIQSLGELSKKTRWKVGD